MELLLKTWSQGRSHKVRLPWQRYICRSKYGCFCLSPKVIYLNTKIEEGLKFFISNFASLSWRIALKTAVPAKEVHFNNIVFLASNHGPITFHELVKGSVCTDVTKLRNCSEVLEKVNELGLPPGGTVVEMKSRIVNHVAKLTRHYERKGFHSDRVISGMIRTQTLFSLRPFL